MKSSIFVRIVSDRLRVSRGQERREFFEANGEGEGRLEVTQGNEDERRYIARINEMVWKIEWPMRLNGKNVRKGERYQLQNPSHKSRQMTNEVGLSAVEKHTCASSSYKSDKSGCKERNAYLIMTLRSEFPPFVLRICKNKCCRPIINIRWPSVTLIIQLYSWENT